MRMGEATGGEAGGKWVGDEREGGKWWRGWAEGSTCCGGRIV